VKVASVGPALAALAVCAALWPHSPATAAGDAVPFTASQAALGAKLYLHSCAACHGANLKGVTAPPLVGQTSGIAQQSIVECYEYVSQQMPQSAPGTLSKAQYASILAFILQKNGHKAGSRPLTESVETTSTATIRAQP
jgi:mono/diheme cytochrome c family protein